MIPHSPPFSPVEDPGWVSVSSVAVSADSCMEVTVGDCLGVGARGDEEAVGYEGVGGKGGF